MIGLLRLCRPYYSVPFSLGYTVILFYARGGQMHGTWLVAGLTTVALALVISAGYVLNDVFDEEVDRINAPRRPIASGQVKRSAGVALGTTLMLLGLGLGLTGRWQFAVVLAVVALGLLIYDLTSKRLGVCKQLMVAALMVSLYPLANAQAGGFTGPRALSLYVFPLWLFVTTFGYELLKDLGDVQGDRRVQRHPSALETQPVRWRTVANASITLGVPLMVIPLWQGCQGVYLVTVGVAGLLALSVWMLSRQAAIAAVYAEVLLVAAGAAVDLTVYGV